MSLAAADPAAEFTLLVPATPTGHLLHNWEEGEARDLARRRAREAMAHPGPRRAPPAPRPQARRRGHAPPARRRRPLARARGGQPLAAGGGRRRAPGPARLRPDRAVDLPPGGVAVAQAQPPGHPPAPRPAG